MASLAQRENFAGKVQMIYLDPPYGIRFGSNFQPETGKRNVKDREADLTREPEMVRAYRDTWRLGVHAYLTYLRDRLSVGPPGISTFTVMPLPANSVAQTAELASSAALVAP